MYYSLLPLLFPSNSLSSPSVSMSLSPSFSLSLLVAPLSSLPLSSLPHPYLSLVLSVRNNQGEPLRAQLMCVLIYIPRCAEEATIHVHVATGIQPTVYHFKLTPFWLPSGRNKIQQLQPPVSLGCSINLPTPIGQAPRGVWVYTFMQVSSLLNYM